MQVSKTTFEHWGSLSDEHMEYNILDWLYFDGKDELVEFPKDKYVKASPIKKHGISWYRPWTKRRWNQITP